MDAKSEEKGGLPLREPTDKKGCQEVMVDDKSRVKRGRKGGRWLGRG